MLFLASGDSVFLALLTLIPNWKAERATMTTAIRMKTMNEICITFLLFLVDIVFFLNERKNIAEKIDFSLI